MSRRDRFNKLSAAEEERLALLSEEMGECIQAIGKIQRHGYESKHPKGGPTNRQKLEIELGHVKYAKILMSRCGDIDFRKTKLSAVRKSNDIGKYLHHQPVDKIRIKISKAALDKIRNASILRSGKSVDGVCEKCLDAPIECCVCEGGNNGMVCVDCQRDAADPKKEPVTTAKI